MYKVGQSVRLIKDRGHRFGTLPDMTRACGSIGKVVQLSPSSSAVRVEYIAIDSYNCKNLSQALFDFTEVESIEKDEGFLDIKGFPTYKFDPKTDTVYSYHPCHKEKPYPMKWQKYYDGDLTKHVKYVKLTENGRVKEVTLADLMNKLTVKKESTKMLQRGKFIIGSEDQYGNVSFAANPAQHNTLGEANKEAERLARSVGGKKFVVVEVKGICQVQQVVWN